jgi:hypothetical protein
MKPNIKTVKTHLGISVIQWKDSNNFVLLGGKDVVPTGNQILMFWGNILSSPSKNKCSTRHSSRTFDLEDEDTMLPPNTRT